MRIGYEHKLDGWIYGDLTGPSIIFFGSPLTYVKALIPWKITEERMGMDGGSVSMETSLKHVPQPILLLATRLAMNQLTQTITSHKWLFLEKIKNILFLTRDDAEKRTVVANIQANSRIRETFGDLQIIDLNQIDDETKREETRLRQTPSVESPTENYRRRGQLVLVVDGDVDKKLDPQKVNLPNKIGSRDVVVFITTLSSGQQNDEFSVKMDLTIKTEDHLLPWEVFCKNVGSELLNSSTDIQSIAVKMVEKCGGHLLAIILMAKSLKDVKDVQTWELALDKLGYGDREPIVNAFFNIIWPNVISETKKKLPPRIARLENIKTLRLAGCKRLKTLPQELWKLQNFDQMPTPSILSAQMPLLNILDLSRTSIRELPNSICNLKKLREFYLKDCELFVELSPHIGGLDNLMILDLDGTLITHLPEEVKYLSKLESLSLSFYNDDASCALIPLGFLSQLNQLRVLRIAVNPDNEWWLGNIERILADINRLEMLQSLDIYIPKVEFLNLKERCPSNFRFIIGYHKPRMILRVPPIIEKVFKESNPSLKFVNGQVFPDKVKSILSKAWAFFLDRHVTINSLTQFGLENLMQLQLCILAECNEMQSIIDVDGYGADSDLNESFCMQFLTIFYMKNLRSIIKNPNHGGNSIFCQLKFLALHTCPELATIFTMDSLQSLGNLEELIVKDCPKVNSIISSTSST
ncbi:uncharacterized protein LOC114721178 [Neltuma alba]|uniref:uncharacterized protein LOC114721178 n=1 Tax=Neltuma alba TaxID=207710 RepID=UPI0010A391C0|nr:uncharacterized protein LOC114721178 [Prosopis alba]